MGSNILIYQIANLVTADFDYVDTEAEADFILNRNKADYLSREAYRFYIAKMTVDGNNSVWSNADVDNDIEAHEYLVFNTYSGQHEPLPSLSAAKARLQELTDRFITECGFDKWNMLDQKPERIYANPMGAQPITTITDF